MNELNIQNIFQDYNDLVDIKTLQKMLDIGRNLAYRLISENKIEHLNINHKILIPKQNVIKFLFEGKVKNER